MGGAQTKENLQLDTSYVQQNLKQDQRLNHPLFGNIILYNQNGQSGLVMNKQFDENQQINMNLIQKIKEYQINSKYIQQFVGYYKADESFQCMDTKMIMLLFEFENNSFIQSHKLRINKFDQYSEQDLLQFIENVASSLQYLQ